MSKNNLKNFFLVFPNNHGVLYMMTTTATQPSTRFLINLLIYSTFPSLSLKKIQKILKSKNHGSTLKLKN